MQDIFLAVKKSLRCTKLSSCSRCPVKKFPKFEKLFDTDLGPRPCLSVITRAAPPSPPAHAALTVTVFCAVRSTELILPSTNVGTKPHPHKLPPPLSVPSSFRGRLKLSDQIRVARKLEYRKSLKDQEPMRRLLAPFAPASRIPAVQVPPHVIGGQTNWEDAIDSLLFFYSLDPKLQRKHSRAAT